MNIFLTLCVAAAAVHLSHARFPQFMQTPFTHKPDHNLGEPLILTPFIEENLIAEARNLSAVKYAPFDITPSYSGFLTVDKPNNSNIFFWFFPTENNYNEDPVVLWLQGGPGGSSLYGLFAEHGPFTVENGSVQKREFSWTKNHSVLYIDQPIGTGFSFTDGDLLTDQNQVGEHLYSAIAQFYALFPELRKNGFYISGESYAGKYVPALGYAIHQNNPTVDETLRINLQGLLIGNGLSDPIHQFKYGDLLYQLGLIDKNTLASFHDQEKVIIETIEKGSNYLASYYWNDLLTFFSQKTQLQNVYNFIKDVDDSPTEWQDFIVQDEVRLALHVGDREYNVQSLGVYYALFEDITRSVAPWVAELLSHYRILVFNGQLDVIVAYVLTENYLQNLNFSAAAEYAQADRNVWTVGNQVAGYVKTAGNLTDVLVRDAGHMVPFEQPEFAYDLLYKFVRNQPIAKN